MLHYTVLAGYNRRARINASMHCNIFMMYEIMASVMRQARVGRHCLLGSKGLLQSAAKGRCRKCRNGEGITCSPHHGYRRQQVSPYLKPWNVIPLSWSTEPYPKPLNVIPLSWSTEPFYSPKTITGHAIMLSFGSWITISREGPPYRSPGPCRTADNGCSASRVTAPCSVVPPSLVKAWPILN